jgi:hypothetical protein
MKSIEKLKKHVNKDVIICEILIKDNFQLDNFVIKQQQ